VYKKGRMMKLLRLSALFILLMGAVNISAKTLTVNDQIVYWTPKMIGHLESVRTIINDKKEVNELIEQWQSFQNNLAPRKSNQKLFLRLSKQNEELFNKISHVRGKK
jgi:hypothetical protein